MAQLPIGRPVEQRLVHPAANGNACDLVVAASVRCQPYDYVMSASGRKRTSRYFYAMSGLPLKADITSATLARPVRLPIDKDDHLSNLLIKDFRYSNILWTACSFSPVGTERYRVSGPNGQGVRQNSAPGCPSTRS